MSPHASHVTRISAHVLTSMITVYFVEQLQQFVDGRSVAWWYATASYGNI
jgi:hypothetical protein